MRSLWWFTENAVAGMGRPGFNAIHWFDLPFAETSVLGWLGQHSSGQIEMASFDAHIRTYLPRIFKFYQMDEAAGRKAVSELESRHGFTKALTQLNARTGILSRFQLEGDSLHFELNPDRLAHEAERLKELGIRRVVALTERHHDREYLAKDFSLHHLSIEDLGAPTAAQVQELAEIVQNAERAGEKLVVHCLAGIGRTSTMLMAAHLHLGEKLDDLKARIARQNPRFVLTGPQADFLEAYARR